MAQSTRWVVSLVLTPISEPLGFFNICIMVISLTASLNKVIVNIKLNNCYVFKNEK